MRGGFSNPPPTCPIFVLNEFELFFPRSEKEASVFRPQRIQGGNCPLGAVSLWQHS